VDLLVLDGLVSAEEIAGTPREFKKFIHELQIQADLADCTMVLLTSAGADQGFASAEHTMVDGLIELQRCNRGRRSLRDLQVHKLRGSDFLQGVHSFQVTDGGIVVHPRIESFYNDQDADDTGDGSLVSTGIAIFDDMLAGGPSRCSTTLILGSAGTGKTTLGLHFLGAEDEPGIYLSFNETPAAIRFKAELLDLPVLQLIDKGQVEVMWQPATEGVFDEICTQLLATVKARKVRRIFIDGLTDFGRMTGDPERVGPVLTALANKLSALGVTTFATSEIDLSGMLPGQPLSGLSVRGVSPFAENIMVLRFAALDSDVHRLAVLLKARSNAIRLDFRYYDITGHGIEIDSDSIRASRILTEIAHRHGGYAPRAAISPEPARDIGGKT
jgi:circadian clock protein KaiC